MLKKKCVFILSLFVGMLFIGLSSTSYAFTENDIKNLIYNYYVNGTTYTDYDNFKNYLDNVDFSNILSSTSNSQYYDLTDFFNNSDYSLFARRSEPGQNGPLIIYFVFNNAEKPIFYSNNRYYVSNMGFLIFRVNTIPAIRCYKRNSVSNADNVGLAYDNILFFDEKDCYNPAYTSIVLAAPYNSPSWFNASGIYDAPEQKFDFEMNITSATEYVYIDTEDGRVTNIPVIYRWDFGILIDTTDYSYLNDNLVMYYWNGNIWKRKQFFIRDLVGKKLTSNAYINISNNATFTEYTMSIPQLFQYNNVLYIYDIMNENNESATATFIVGDGNTSIVNGTINTNFSGDYNSQFNNLDNIINNNNNTNDILNALTDSNYSGDISLNDLPSIEVDDISSDFFTWLLTQFLNVINSTTNVYLEIPIYNNTYRIASNEFVLDVQPLKTFISSGWWFVCGVPFLKFIRRTIEHLKGGNVPLSDDKSDLLGNIL